MQVTDQLHKLSRKVNNEPAKRSAIQRIIVPDEFADIARNGSDQHEQYLKHLPTKTKRYHLNGIQLISLIFSVIGLNRFNFCLNNIQGSF